MSMKETHVLIYLKGRPDKVEEFKDLLYRKIDKLCIEHDLDGYGDEKLLSIDLDFTVYESKLDKFIDCVKKEAIKYRFDFGINISMTLKTYEKIDLW